MTYYKQGFLSKCAEYGLSGDTFRYIEKKAATLAALKGWIRMAATNPAKFKRALESAKATMRLGRRATPGLKKPHDVARAVLLSKITDKAQRASLLDMVNRAEREVSLLSGRRKFVDTPLTNLELSRGIESAMRNAGSTATLVPYPTDIARSAADFLRY